VCDVITLKLSASAAVTTSSETFLITRERPESEAVLG